MINTDILNGKLKPTRGYMLSNPTIKPGDIVEKNDAGQLISISTPIALYTYHYRDDKLVSVTGHKKL